MFKIGKSTLGIYICFSRFFKNISSSIIPHKLIKIQLESSIIPYALKISWKHPHELIKILTCVQIFSRTPYDLLKNSLWAPQESLKDSSRILLKFHKNSSSTWYNSKWMTRYNSKWMTCNKTVQEKAAEIITYSVMPEGEKHWGCQ